MPYEVIEEPYGDDWGIVTRNFRNLRKDMNPPVPQARVYNSVDVVIGNNAVTAVTFNSERWDEGALHSTSSTTSRLTAPITGLYQIHAHIRLAANSTGVREAHLRVNGTTFIDYRNEPTPSATQPTIFGLGTQYRLLAGDYVEVTVYQNSGGNLNVTAAGNSSPEFAMCRTGGYVNQGV
jgi:hypothetical protein